jgi:hypothetical protein
MREKFRLVRGNTDGEDDVMDYKDLMLIEGV